MDRFAFPSVVNAGRVGCIFIGAGGASAAVAPISVFHQLGRTSRRDQVRHHLLLRVMDPSGPMSPTVPDCLCGYNFMALAMARNSSGNNFDTPWACAGWRI